MSGFAACDQYDGIGLAALVRRREVRADEVLEAATVCTVVIQTVMAGCQLTCLPVIRGRLQLMLREACPRKGVQDTVAVWSRDPGTLRREGHVGLQDIWTVSP
jgi:hypothetical protein